MSTLALHWTPHCNIAQWLIIAEHGDNQSAVFTDFELNYIINLRSVIQDTHRAKPRVHRIIHHLLTVLLSLVTDPDLIVYIILSKFPVPHFQEIQQRPGQSHVVEERQNHYYTRHCYHSKYLVANDFIWILLLVIEIKTFVKLLLVTDCLFPGSRSRSCDLDPSCGFQVLTQTRYLTLYHKLFSTFAPTDDNEQWFQLEAGVIQ